MTKRFEALKVEMVNDAIHEEFKRFLEAQYRQMIAEQRKHMLYDMYGENGAMLFEALEIMCKLDILDIRSENGASDIRELLDYIHQHWRPLEPERMFRGISLGL